MEKGDKQWLARIGGCWRGQIFRIKLVGLGQSNNYFINYMSKKLIMTIGLPFSGKSTLAKDYAAKGYTVIDRDDFLSKILESDEFKINVKREIDQNNIDPNDGRAIFAIQNELAIKTLSAQVKNLVLNSSQENFFYDATNLQKESRAPIVGLGSQGIEIEGIYLKVPLEELKKRANLAFENRQGKFNDIRNLDVFAKMLEEPTLSEGFSNLEVRNPLAETQREFKLKVA